MNQKRRKLKRNLEKNSWLNNIYCVCIGIMSFYLIHSILIEITINCIEKYLNHLELFKMYGVGFCTDISVRELWCSYCLIL